MAKARAGAVVSSLPVGWIKGPDGKYDFDPEVKDAIPAIIDTFRQQRSIRRTIKALAEAGNQSTLQTREAALLRKAKSQQHKEPKPAVNSP